MPASECEPVLNCHYTPTNHDNLRTYGFVAKRIRAHAHEEKEAGDAREASLVRRLYGMHARSTALPRLQAVGVPSTVTVGTGWPGSLWLTLASSVRPSETQSTS